WRRLLSDIRRPLRAHGYGQRAALAAYAGGTARERVGEGSAPQPINLRHDATQPNAWLAGQAIRWRAGRGERAAGRAGQSRSNGAYWHGLPGVEATDAAPISAQHATPAPTARRAIASAAAAPWPLAERTDSEPVANALAYAAQPNPIAVARTLPVGGGTARPT